MQINYFKLNLPWVSHAAFQLTTHISFYDSIKKKEKSFFKYRNLEKQNRKKNKYKQNKTAHGFKLIIKNLR